MSAIAAIPARLESTRFPKKVLADLGGKPMLWHVFQGVSQAKLIDEVWIMTDSEEVMDAAASWGARVVMTPADCPSGTDRIAWVADQINADIIVNVQGDEPLIKGYVVDAVVEALENSDSDVATPVYQIKDIDELTNPNVVKVVRATNGQALYFSRTPVPYIRDLPQADWPTASTYWGHVGVYAYRKEVLVEYPNLPPAELEQLEKLEQLRLLEAGKQILAMPIDYRPHAVDVPADLEVVKGLIAMEMTK
jgi:3-deoxy-manno-octulosonate cytidylyltransferase (CMP-KDO synthetase)